LSFSGRVSRESNEGGLLVSFEGRAPRLGARIRISGGRILGKVDTVLGNVNSPLIHIHPLYDGIDPRASVGSPVEIAPRDRTPRKGRHRHKSYGNYRDRGVSRKGGHRKGGQRTIRENRSGERSERVHRRPRKGQSGSVRGRRKSAGRKGSGGRKGSSKRPRSGRRG